MVRTIRLVSIVLTFAMGWGVAQGRRIAPGWRSISPDLRSGRR